MQPEKISKEKGELRSKKQCQNRETSRPEEDAASEGDPGAAVEETTQPMPDELRYSFVNLLIRIRKDTLKTVFIVVCSLPSTILKAEF